MAQRCNSKHYRFVGKDLNFLHRLSTIRCQRGCNVGKVSWTWLGSIGRSSLAESWSGTEFPGSAQWREAPRVEIPPGAGATALPGSRWWAGRDLYPHTLLQHFAPSFKQLFGKGKTSYIGKTGSEAFTASGSDAWSSHSLYPRTLITPIEDNLPLCNIILKNQACVERSAKKKD